MGILESVREKLARIARHNRQEIVRARLSRREMVRLGLLTSAGYLVSKRGLAARASYDGGDDDCRPGSSPDTRAFIEPLPILPILPDHPTGELDPPPSEFPNNAINPATGLPFEGRGQFNGELRPGTDAFQFFGRFPPEKFYVTRMKALTARVSPDLPEQTLWGFDLGDGGPAVSPGPTIVAHYGEPMLIRRVNALPPEGQNGGFGIPSVTTHLHNFHSGSESDGGPCRYFERGQYFDYHCTMAAAGFDTSRLAPGALGGARYRGDIRESMSTLWYHDHRVDNTSQNVYKGLAGFFLAFNEFDTGDELTGFHLPSFPAFDVPLLLTDKLFDPSSGLLCFDLFDFDGLVGDKFLVNGKIQPYFEVSRRRYRFRILNVGPSRFYQLYLTDLAHRSTSIPFWVIANDGNLLPRPVQVTNVRLGVAERMDIIVDFAALPNSPSVLYLENRLEQEDGRGPTDDIVSPGQGDRLLEFRVGNGVRDDSVDPATLPHFYDLPDTGDPPRITRHFRFERTNGQWAVNGRFMSCNSTRFRVRRNSVERWVIENSSGGWQHPIHIHLEEGQILRRNGHPTAPGSVENSRKDVIRLGFNETAELFYRFRDFRGDYPIHCHNVLHEDHAMMLLFGVDDDGDDDTRP